MHGIMTKTSLFHAAGGEQMSLQGSPKPWTSEVRHRLWQPVHKVRGAVHKPTPARLSTDWWDVQEVILSCGPGVVVMVAVRADLTGDALGLA